MWELKGVCDVQKYGHPSWRALVRAVADPISGANPALAHSIAAKPSGNSNSIATHKNYAIESPVVSHISP